MPLLFLESVGTTELVVVLMMALVVFGPRRLPELARSWGDKLTELKRATNAFKTTWEREVTIESIEREVAIERVRIAETLPTPAVLTEEHAASAETPQAMTVTLPQGATVERGSHGETTALTVTS